jgi:hypothetical protein
MGGGNAREPLSDNIHLFKTVIDLNDVEMGLRSRTARQWRWVVVSTEENERGVTHHCCHRTQTTGRGERGRGDRGSDTHSPMTARRSFS